MFKIKLETCINFNNRKLDITLLGTHNQEDSVVTLDQVVTKVKVKDTEQGEEFEEVDISELFNKEELDDLMDLLYTNGEVINEAT